MGLSSSPEEWIDLPQIKASPVPILHRCSGGGTVYVDDNTLFATFIMSRHSLPIEPFPKSILHWTADFYRNALGLDLTLVENDYTLSNKKIGGNAQYLKKEKWLHHTTFLYDYDPKKMNLLLNPKRQPDYRNGRNHDDFLTTLKSHLTKKEFCNNIIRYLNTLFDVKIKPIPSSFPAHRISTSLYLS